jgi:hypothetical protein
MAAAKPVSDVDDENDDDEDKLGILAAAADSAVPAAPNDDSVLWLRDGTSVPFSRTADKRFACPVPGCVRTTGAAAGELFVLATKVALIEHLQSKHGWTHYARFPCTVHGCGRAFAFAAKLKAHALTHDETKRAEAAARRKAKEDAARAALGVAKHSKTVVRRAVQTVIVDGVETFPCPLPGCIASFTSYYLVNKHRKRDHGDDERLDPTRPPPPKPEHTHKRQRREGVATCACEYCDKPCVTASDRVAHYRACHAALRVFDAALPSDDLRACLRIIQRLPGTHKAPLAAMMSNDDDDDVKDDDADADDDGHDDVEDNDVHADAEDDAGVDDDNGGSDTESDEDDDVGVPSGLTKSIASAIVLYRVSASGEPLQLRCSVATCDVITNTCNAHACHVRAVHRPKPTVAFACDQCAYTSTSQGRLRVHVRDVHRTERQYLCSASATCSASFKTRGDMRKHEATVHADASDAVSCRICSKAFRSERALANHMYVHAPRKHVCAACGDAFTFPSKLRKHARLHPGGDGLFTCSAPACDGKFVLYDQVRWHEILKHGAPSVQCKQCMSLFITKTAMLRHVEEVHVNVAYTPGKSDGERFIWQTLTKAGLRFRTEVVIGNRLRIDFAVCWPDGTMCSAIEYDGAHHFAPSGGAVEHAWDFLAQVQRDNEKTRLLQAASVPLLRLTGRVTEQSVLEGVRQSLRRVLNRDPGDSPFREYLMSGAFTCSAAERLRRLVQTRPSVPSAPAISSAARFLLASLPVSYGVAVLLGSCSPLCGDGGCEAHCANAPKFLRFAEAALTLFLAHCARQPDGGAGALGDERKLAACLAVASTLREFTTSSMVTLSRMPHLTAPQREYALRAAAGDVRVSSALSLSDGGTSMRANVLHCWYDDCQVFFSTSAHRPADDLLRHIVAAHRADVAVRCCVDGCGETASCRSELALHTKASHPDCSQKHIDRVFCAVDGCATPSFSSWARWFRHMNEHHGTQFPPLLLRTCAECSRSFSSMKLMDEHVCVL